MTMLAIVKAVLLFLAILVGGGVVPNLPASWRWRVALCAVLCCLFVWTISGGL